MFSTVSFGENQENFIKPEMYGVYHNELLQSYTKKFKKDEISDFIGFYDNLKKQFDILHPNVLTEEENKFYRNRLLEVIGSGTVMTMKILNHSQL